MAVEYRPMLKEGDPLLNLATAAREGNVAYLQMGGDQLGTVDGHGDSVLSHAVDENSEASYHAMQFIAETPYFQALLHRPSNEGHYPLLYAALRDDVRFLKDLLQRGARVLLPNQKRYLSPNANSRAPLSLLHLLVYGRKTFALHVVLLDLDTPGKYTPEERNALFTFRTVAHNPHTGESSVRPLNALELAAELGVTIRGVSVASLVQTLAAPPEPEIYR